MSVRFAIVGVRNFAKSHYRKVKQLEETGEGKLVGIVVTDQVKNAEAVEQFKKEGLIIWDTYEQLLVDGKDKVDIICLPTSIHSHAELAAAAMKQGYNVIMEKPPVPTIDEFDSLREVEKETGQFCSVGFQFMHSPTIRRLKEMILAGEFGELQNIAVKGYWPRLKSYYTRNAWAGKLIHDGRLVLDGPVHNALAHYLQNMIFLAGEEQEKSANLKTVRAELYRGHTYIQSDDTSVLEIETVNGVKIYFYVTHCSDINYGPIMEIIGTKATATWNMKQETKITYADGRVEEFDGGDSDPWLEVMRVPAKVHKGELKKLMCTLDNTRSFQVAVNGMWLSAKKVREIPTQYVKEFLDEKGDLRTEVADIVKYLDQAFAERKLLSDIGVEWAVATEPYNVEDLKEFNPFK